MIAERTATMDEFDQDEPDEPRKPAPGFTEHGTRKVTVHLYAAELAILKAFGRELPPGTRPTVSNIVRHILHWASNQRRQTKP